ncbi:MAG TPA: hypothetical protein VHR97_01620 [Candidatus Baltobacteraceae bacterium]|jgi:hypothetical protein|nr:hypothetical protein [Candidatus Baltobacteraceae bacterium]
MSNSASFWTCGRCHCSNPCGVGICQNPQCGGEPVSRTVEAVATPSTQRAPWVFNPDRQCNTRDGIPKIGYASFAYRCLEHGWHVGSNRDAA